MKIDIQQGPPADIFQDRGKYIWICSILFALACGGLLLGAYGIYTGALHNEWRENVALALFAGPGILFAYLGQKLLAYQKLTSEQEKELAEMMSQFPQISAYMAKVAAEKRQPVLAEFEACQYLVEELKGSSAEKESKS